jgi:hypothetical protein
VKIQLGASGLRGYTAGLTGGATAVGHGGLSFSGRWNSGSALNLRKMAIRSRYRAIQPGGMQRDGAGNC